jgi:hypothetical protein
MSEAQAAQSDNLQQSTTLLSTVSDSVDTTDSNISNDTIVDNSDNPYHYVPEKFMKDGEPDFEKLTKSYTELEKKIGVKAPATSITDYQYEFQKPEDFDMDGFEAFKGIALEQGLTPKQFETVIGLYENSVSAMLSDLRPSAEKASEVLSQEWGDEMDSNMKSAFKAFKQFAPDDLSIDVVGNDPNVIRLLANIGKKMNEDNGLNTGKVGNASKMSKLEIDEMMRSSDYFDNREKQKIVTDWYNSTYK